MEADRDRHRLGAEVGDRRPHFEHAVLQPIASSRSCARTATASSTPAGGRTRAGSSPTPIGASALRLDHLPLVGRLQKAVDRNRAAHVAELHVERVPLAVGVERLFVEPVGPRRREAGCRSAPGFALNSSIDAYGQRSTLWPFTFISKAMLPTLGTIETRVCAFASSSCTTSPVLRRATYCCVARRRRRRAIAQRESRSSSDASRRACDSLRKREA